MADLEIRLDQLTLGHMVKAERATGKPFGELFAGGTPTAEGIAALVYALQSSSNPDFTFDDALNIQIEDLPSVAPTDPTGAAG